MSSPSTDRIIIGPRIQEAMEQRGVTAEQLARKMRVTVQSVYRWLKDEPRPNYERVEEIAATLGVAPLSFFCGEHGAKKEELRPRGSAAPLFDESEIVAARRSGQGSVQVGEHKDSTPEAPAFPFVVFDLGGEDFLELEVRARGRSHPLRFTVGMRGTGKTFTGRRRIVRPPPKGPGAPSRNHDSDAP